jgi:seryl-tRNA synthetase
MTNRRFGKPLFGGMLVVCLFLLYKTSVNYESNKDKLIEEINTIQQQQGKVIKLQEERITTLIAEMTKQDKILQGQIDSLKKQAAADKDVIKSMQKTLSGSNKGDF